MPKTLRQTQNTFEAETNFYSARINNLISYSRAVIGNSSTTHQLITLFYPSNIPRAHDNFPSNLALQLSTPFEFSIKMPSSARSFAALFLVGWSLNSFGTTSLRCPFGVGPSLFFWRPSIGPWFTPDRASLRRGPKVASPTPTSHVYYSVCRSNTLPPLCMEKP